MTPDEYRIHKNIYKKKWDQAHWLPSEERQKRLQEKLTGQQIIHNVLLAYDALNARTAKESRPQ